jgi:hypothetical protein
VTEARSIFYLLLFLAAIVVLGTTGCASTPPPPPPAEVVKELCTADTDIEAGKASIKLSPYPCVIAKTYAAMDATQGRGPIQGSVARFFLRTRLVARGIFSTVFGLVGLG